MTRQKGLPVLYGSLAVMSVLLMAGCHTDSTGSSNPAAGTAQAIQQIQNNPNIPPQAKANMINQMSGKSIPNSKPVSPPH